jgi:muramidase (phage lysozyme)
MDLKLMTAHSLIWRICVLALLALCPLFVYATDQRVIVQGPLSVRDAAQLREILTVYQQHGHCEAVRDLMNTARQLEAEHVAAKLKGWSIGGTLFTDQVAFDSMCSEAAKKYRLLTEAYADKRSHFTIQRFDQVLSLANDSGYCGVAVDLIHTQKIMRDADLLRLLEGYHNGPVVRRFGLMNSDAMISECEHAKYILKQIFAQDLGW